MEVDDADKLIREAEVKTKVTLKPEELRNLLVLLNVEISLVEENVSVGGDRVAPLLSKRDAQPLNEVFKQLVGQDHDSYRRRFGQTMSAADPPVRSNRVDIGNEERIALSRLVDRGFHTAAQDDLMGNTSPGYIKSLTKLEQAFAVQNQPLPPKS